jgi:hypothetical protein
MDIEYLSVLEVFLPIDNYDFIKTGIFELK